MLLHGRGCSRKLLCIERLWIQPLLLLWFGCPSHQLHSMEKATKVTPFRLTSLIRREANPHLALQLFRNPVPSSSKTFRRSARSYDLVICKLGKGRMFTEMEDVLRQMSLETRFVAKEALFCRIISFYGRARMPAEAQRTFERIPSFRCLRTIRSFNTLLHATISCGDLEGANSLLRGLDDYCLTPDAYTYNVLIRAHIVSGSLPGAWELFDDMRTRGIDPTAVTFATLVSGLCANSMLDDAFRLKETMVKQHNVKPNVCVYTSLLKGLCKDGKLDLALQLKEEMLLDTNLKLESNVYSTLIRFLFEASRKGEVVDILEEMKRLGVKPDVVTYNAILSGFCKDEKDFDAAYETLNEMVKQGCKPDVVSYNTIISGLCEAGKWMDASELFDDMPRRGCSPDVVSYRTLFKGLCDAGQIRRARMVMDEMLFKGYKPYPVSLWKFLETLLNGEEDWSLVWSTLTNLVKAKAMGSDEWEKTISTTLVESENLIVRELLHSLTVR